MRPIRGAVKAERVVDCSCGQTWEGKNKEPPGEKVWKDGKRAREVPWNETGDFRNSPKSMKVDDVGSIR